MEILQFLLSYFLKNKGFEKLAPLFELFKANSFDLKRVLQNLNPSVLEPILDMFINFQNKNAPPNNGGAFNGLTPVSSFADKEIVNALNKYLS